MEPKARPMVVYVLPSYDSNTGSHFFHLYEFLKKAAEGLDLFVVVERCQRTSSVPRFRHYCQRFSWLPARFFEILFVLALKRLSGCKNFYVHYSFFGALASWLVAAIFGGSVYYWNSGMPWMYRRPWLEELVFRFILRHTFLVTHPMTLAEEYRRRYALRPERISILPHFISVSRFHDPTITRESARRVLNIPLEAKVILFVHRLSRRKGAHLLPDIIFGVTKLRKDVMFVIVGDGPERANIESRIKNHDLGRYARLAGAIPQRDIAPYFRAADFFLLPSEEEGFPHVLLEAMAAGIPYVATDVGGVRELTPPELQEFIVPSGDIGAIAAGIVRLIAKSKSEIFHITKIEREWVRRYDIGAVLSKFFDLFDPSNRFAHPCRFDPKVMAKVTVPVLMLVLSFIAAFPEIREFPPLEPILRRTGEFIEDRKRYQAINSLHTGLRIAYLEGIFKKTPIIKRSLPKSFVVFERESGTTTINVKSLRSFVGGYTERIYEDQKYFLQLITQDGQDDVVAFILTVIDTEFHPGISLPSQRSKKEDSIELGVTTFGDFQWHTPSDTNIDFQGDTPLSAEVSQRSNDYFYVEGRYLGDPIEYYIFSITPHGISWNQKRNTVDWLSYKYLLEDENHRKRLVEAQFIGDKPNSVAVVSPTHQELVEYFITQGIGPSDYVVGAVR